MTDSERAALEPIIRLHLTDGVGPVTFANLVERFGSADAALGASESQLATVPGIGAITAKKIAVSREQADVAGEFELIEQLGVTVLTQRDARYPYPLRHVADPSPVLYVQGELKDADAVSLAVVGSRRCSRYGHEQAERFSNLLARAGVTVVSGMARGIDAAAHGGAMAGGGRTVAVLGCGLSITYPPEHDKLRAQIIERGAVISELPIRTAPEAGNFPSRNRIIAGLSLGTLVVEAAAQSGALITARLAQEYNREVFALPGRVDSPFSQGPHNLIRDGAKLVQCLDDILDELGDVGKTLRPPGPDPLADDVPLVKLTPGEDKLMAVMDGDPRGIEELAGLAKLPLPEVMGLLTQLQLKAQVSQLPGQLFIRRGRNSAAGGKLFE
ncbi:MAG: DNA-processing protein DprA [Phycisphaerae bacterium]|nr:DNA-processing protein DprA [Phycisphaerae bacterium]